MATRLGITTVVLPVVAVLLVSCGDPWRNDIPDRWCAPEDVEIYAPPPQGPEGTQGTSIEALQCIVDAYESGEEAGLRVTILGIEGGGHPSMIRTHSDGSVDLYMKQGLGWEISLACSSFDVLEPGTIEIGACERTLGQISAIESSVCVTCWPLISRLSDAAVRFVVFGYDGRSTR